MKTGNCGETNNKNPRMKNPGKEIMKEQLKVHLVRLWNN